MKKKLTAVILAAALALSALLLASCGSGTAGTDELVGVWRTAFPLLELTEGMVEDSLGATLDLSEAKDDAIFETIELTSDGKVIQKVDEKATRDSIDHYLSVLRDKLSEYFMNEIASEGANVTLDEYLQRYGFESFDELMDIFAEAVSFESMTEGVELEDEYRYTAKDGKMYSYDSIIDTSCYETYDLNGNTLTFTGSVGYEDSGSEDEGYPIVYVKVD